MQLRKYGRTWFTGRCILPVELAPAEATRDLPNRTTCLICQPIARHVLLLETSSSIIAFFHFTATANTLMFLRRPCTTEHCQVLTSPETGFSIPIPWNQTASMNGQHGSAVPAVHQTLHVLSRPSPGISTVSLIMTCMSTCSLRTMQILQ